jgi:hypothetical protein
LRDCLEAELRSLIAEAEVQAEKDWIRKQDAAELATLFGVRFDRTMRVLGLAGLFLRNRGEG